MKNILDIGFKFQLSCLIRIEFSTQRNLQKSAWNLKLIDHFTLKLLQGNKLSKVKTELVYVED